MSCNFFSACTGTFCSKETYVYLVRNVFVWPEFGSNNQWSWLVRSTHRSRLVSCLACTSLHRNASGTLLDRQIKNAGLAPHKMKMVIVALSQQLPDARWYVLMSQEHGCVLGKCLRSLFYIVWCKYIRVRFAFQNLLLLLSPGSSFADVNEQPPYAAGSWLVNSAEIASKTTIYRKSEEFTRLDYAMETKTSNRCCNPADEGTFTALGFFRVFEEFRTHFNMLWWSGDMDMDMTWPNGLNHRGADLRTLCEHE